MHNSILRLLVLVLMAISVGQSNCVDHKLHSPQQSEYCDKSIQNALRHLNILINENGEIGNIFHDLDTLIIAELKLKGKLGRAGYKYGIRKMSDMRINALFLTDKHPYLGEPYNISSVSVIDLVEKADKPIWHNELQKYINSRNEVFEKAECTNEPDSIKIPSEMMCLNTADSSILIDIFSTPVYSNRENYAVEFTLVPLHSLQERNGVYAMDVTIIVDKQNGSLIHWIGGLRAGSMSLYDSQCKKVYQAPR